MKFLKIFTLIISTIIIASCAQIVTPSGGSKDEVEPKVVNYIPNNKSINFKQLLSFSLFIICLYIYNIYYIYHFFNYKKINYYINILYKYILLL